MNKLAVTLSADEHAIVDRSGHYIQSDRPERVVAAIRSVVARARGED